MVSELSTILSSPCETSFRQRSKVYRALFSLEIIRLVTLSLERIILILVLFYSIPTIKFKNFVRTVDIKRTSVEMARDGRIKKKERKKTAVVKTRM